MKILYQKLCISSNKNHDNSVNTKLYCLPVQGLGIWSLLTCKNTLHWPCNVCLTIKCSPQGTSIKDLEHQRSPHPRGTSLGCRIALVLWRQPDQSCGAVGEEQKATTLW